jgi:hypothetical protein
LQPYERVEHEIRDHVQGDRERLLDRHSKRRVVDVERVDPQLGEL